MPRLLACLLLTIALTVPVPGRAQELAAALHQRLPQAEVLRLTLAQAIRIALEKDPGLKQSANQVASRNIDVAQRQADFAPDLTARLTGAEHFDKTIDPLDGNTDRRDYETASGSLDSTVNLFNGFGDIAALRGAERELAGEQSSYSRAAQTLLFDTVSAFLQTLSSRELIRVRNENLGANLQQQEQVEALYRAGNRPVSDLYQQQAETANAVLDLLLAERDYAVASRRLLQVIGMPPSGRVDLQAPDLAPLEAALVALQLGPPDLAALDQRSDLQAAKYQIEAAAEQIDEARAGYWPTLNLSASLASDYSSLEKGTDFSRQFFDHNPQADIGLTLAVPIFDRLQTRHQVAQARLRQDNARLTLHQRQLQAETELGQAINDFRTAQQLIGVTKTRLTAARQALAAMEERYRVGAATLTELAQLRTQFAEADFERVKARYQLITQEVAIAYYLGDGQRLQALLDQWENAQ